jgi:hypothetical protein
VSAHVVVAGGEEATDVELSRGSISADTMATKPRSRRARASFIVVEVG